jgi:hypothetical protein
MSNFRTTFYSVIYQESHRLNTTCDFSVHYYKVNHMPALSLCNSALKSKRSLKVMNTPYNCFLYITIRVHSFLYIRCHYIDKIAAANVVGGDEEMQWYEEDWRQKKVGGRVIQFYQTFFHWASYFNISFNIMDLYKLVSEQWFLNSSKVTGPN